MSATRIKLPREKFSAWAHKQAPSCPSPLEMTRIVRDEQGNVHTPNGYLSKEAYEQTRAANPHVALPEHSAIPFFDELNDSDDFAFHRMSDDGGPEVSIQ